MIDAHCHLDDPRLAPDLDAVLARARAAGVRGCVVAGVDPDGWRAQTELARQVPGVAVTYGVHPRVAAEATDGALDAMLAALDEAVRGGGHARPVGLGEVGLDAWSKDLRATLDRQERAMRAQLALARDVDLPVVLHILRAHGRALELLRADGVPRSGGMVHCYSGPAELVPDYLALGLHVSFAGPVTWPDAAKAAAAARAVPVDRLLVETDAPDLPPVPHRGERNEPAYLPHVVAAVAAARGEDPAEVAATTAANARRLFPDLGDFTP